MARGQLVAVMLVLGGVLMSVMSDARGADQPPSSPHVPLPPDTPVTNPAAGVHSVGPFRVFQPKKLKLPLSFEYPENWIAGEEAGRESRYQQVIILGPRNTVNTYNAGLTIRISPPKQAGGDYGSVDELIGWRRTQLLNAGPSEVLADHPAPLLGLTGAELEVKSETQLSVAHDGPLIDTTLRTHMLVVSDGVRFFEFIYSADAQDYERLHNAFDHLLATLKFQ